MTSIVGRASVLAALRTAVDRAIGGEPMVVLLAGEPGIGKSTLAREAADHGIAAGATGAWGSGWDADGAPPFWPWRQVLRALGAHGPATSTTPTDPAGPVATGADPPDARFRLFAEALDVLAARSAPVVVVLDDLQWADPGSLRLFGFLGRQLQAAPVALIGTYRTADPRPPRALRALLADLAGVAVTHELTGLTAAEVGQLLAMSGAAVPADLAARLHRRTGGNPFFVRELAAAGTDAGSASGPAPFRNESAVPPTVHAAIDRRLRRLPADAARLLGVCALIGGRIPLPLLDAVLADPRSGLPPGPTSAQVRLAPVVDDRLLLREPAALAFPHDLVREVASALLDPDTRTSVHAAVASCLRTRGASAAEIARHVVAAGGALPPDEVVDACRSAADEARAAMAHESATRWRRRAVEAAPAATPELRLDLADAAGRSGDHELARTVYLQVGRTGRGADLIRAALGLQALGTATESSHRDVIDLLERALDDPAAAPATAADRARIGAALARELADGPDGDLPRATRLVESAVAAARRLDDRPTLAVCLFAAHDVAWGPGSAAVRLTLAHEMAIAAAGDVELTFEALFCRFVAQVDLGDPGLDATLRDLEAHAVTHRLPRHLFLVRSRQASIAGLRGRLDEAARLRDEADAVAALIDHPDRQAVRATQVMAEALARGGPAELGRLHSGAGPLVPHELEPEIQAFRALAADRPQEAAAILRAAPSPMARARFRWRALAAVGLSADAALAIGAPDLCERLYAELRPYADELLDVGGAVIVLGPASMYLGRLAAALGRPDAADAHLRDAVEAAARIGAQPCVDRCRAALAALSAPAEGTFRRDGSTWTLSFAGRSVTVPDAKGLTDLATLLRHQGADIAATRLLTGGAAAGSGADEILDATARSAFRARLDALERALDEAAAAGRPTTDLTAERDALIAELASASGLGGRSRRLGDPIERARTTVTARIRDVLRRLDDLHPDLAAHLRASVTTGRTCGYRPDRPVRWRL